MFKKSICVMLTLMITVSLLSGLPGTASAEETITSGDYTYVLVENDDEALVAEITKRVIAALGK